MRFLHTYRLSEYNPLGVLANNFIQTQSAYLCSLDSEGFRIDRSRGLSTWTGYTYSLQPAGHMHPRVAMDVA